VIFALLTIVHVWRMAAEGLVKDPHFIALTVLTASMAFWSFWVLRRSRAPL
jgi:hypothetical protein